MFNFNEENNIKFEEWNKQHNCSLKKDAGAIGGRLTYSFTPTGLGVIKKVKCGCGAWLDLTDYEEW